MTFQSGQSHKLYEYVVIDEYTKMQTQIYRKSFCFVLNYNFTKKNRRFFSYQLLHFRNFPPFRFVRSVNGSCRTSDFQFILGKIARNGY